MGTAESVEIHESTSGTITMSTITTTTTTEIIEDLPPPVEDSAPVATPEDIATMSQHFEESNRRNHAAFNNLQELSAKGYMLAKGFLMVLYATGRGVIPRPDIAQAQIYSKAVLTWLQASPYVEEVGYDVIDLKFRHFFLGICCFYGLSMPRDLRKAVDWYEASACRGYPWVSLHHRLSQRAADHLPLYIPRPCII